MYKVEYLMLEMDKTLVKCFLIKYCSSIWKNALRSTLIF
jgi:hypothetical protein